MIDLFGMTIDEVFGYKDPPETSEHFKHAVTYDLREVRGLVPPLAVGEPVPGCPCEDCTGISEDHEVRKMPKLVSSPDWEDRVSTARSMNLLDVAHRLGIELKKKGVDSFFGNCPFHEDKTPSLHASPTKGSSGVWYCFSCQRGGDPIALVMEVNNMTFPEAVKELIA